MAKSNGLPQETRDMLWAFYRHLRGVLKDQTLAKVLGDRKVKGIVKSLEDLLHVRPETRVGE